MKGEKPGNIHQKHKLVQNLNNFSLFKNFSLFISMQAQAFGQIVEEALSVTRLKPDDFLREMALYLFQQEQITLEHAAHFAKMTRLQFQHLLASRNIFIHYTPENVEDDFANFSLLRPSLSQ